MEGERFALSLWLPSHRTGVWGTALSTSQLFLPVSLWCLSETLDYNISAQLAFS